MRRSRFSVSEKYVTWATAPCGTRFESIHSVPGTYTRLQTLVFDSLIEEFRGSIVVTPSTLKL